jgi:hypothetical protein
LYPLALLAEDINEKAPPKIAEGFTGITLAYNVKSEAEMHEIMNLARKRPVRSSRRSRSSYYNGLYAFRVEAGKWR